MNFSSVFLSFFSFLPSSLSPSFPPSLPLFFSLSFLLSLPSLSFLFKVIQWVVLFLVEKEVEYIWPTEIQLIILFFQNMDILVIQFSYLFDVFMHMCLCFPNRVITGCFSWKKFFCCKYPWDHLVRPESTR